MHKGWFLILDEHEGLSSMLLDSVHNLTRANHSIHDPGLTDKGVKQCEVLEKYFPEHDSVDLIVCKSFQAS